MEKEFVPYELALELKELGFDKLCICIYNREKALRANVFNNPNDRFKSVQLSYNNGKIPAPLYQQAFRWFREKYNLESHVKKDWTDGILHGYESIIECLDGYIDVGTFKTYEEAELECLRKLIEIIKMNNNE